jgi:hypothetical protein
VFAVLWSPALVFLYEMLPINHPGPVDGAFALTGSAGVIITQSLRRNLKKAFIAGLRNSFKKY